MKRKILTSLALLIAITAAITLAVRYNSTNEASSDKLQVVASYYPLYDFARHVAGDDAQVTNLTPPGAEPHDYEPSPSVLARTQKADVFVYNGGELEPWVDNFVATSKPKNTVKASDNIELREAEDAKDPHFWLDPIYAQQIVRNIAAGLSAADPANKKQYEANADKYIGSLKALDNEYRTGLAACANRTVISSHDAFSYLAARYNFEVTSIAGLSTEEEPSAAQLAEVSRFVKEQGIRYIFFESLVSPRLADTIAAETGAQTLVFDPIEGLTDEAQRQGKDYLSVQRDNLKNLRIALACQ